MSEDMKFAKDYQDTFNEIKAPTELYEKVLAMSQIDNIRKKVSPIKRLAASIVITVGLLIVGNGIVYAATGNNFLESITYIVGTILEKRLTVKLDENGESYYEGTYKGTEGETTVTSDSDYEDLMIESPNTMITTITVLGIEVVEEGERFYLTDDDIKIDITEDLKDGSATGTYEKNGCTFRYTVTELAGQWDIRTINETYRENSKETPLT